MHSLKAPDSDGLPWLFFKTYWTIEGSQVVLAVQNFFSKVWLLPQLNHTFITFIPKKMGTCNFNHFMHISLCNFYYKIFSKIIVNRLRPLLSRIIDPTQAAFVPNWWITKNVVLAQEVVHSFKKSKKKKKKGDQWGLSLIFVSLMIALNGSLSTKFLQLWVLTRSLLGWSNSVSIQLLYLAPQWK